MKSTIKILSLLALFAVAAPSATFAADKKTDTTTADTKSATKTKAIPFHGTLGAITDKQLTIKYAKGDKNYVIASTTEILNNREDKKPAKVSDAKVGSEVSGTYTKGADGTLTLVHLYVAPKVAEKTAKTADTTTKTADSSATTTSTATTPATADSSTKKKKKKTDTTDTTTPPKSN